MFCPWYCSYNLPLDYKATLIINVFWRSEVRKSHHTPTDPLEISLKKMLYLLMYDTF